MVDDDDEVRLSTQDHLRSYGARVVAFDSAEAFLRAPEAASVDALITDYWMPGRTGAELIEGLRLRGATMPAIVISACDSGSTEARVLARGAVRFLRKPVDPDELVGVLKQFDCLS